MGRNSQWPTVPMPVRPMFFGGAPAAPSGFTADAGYTALNGFCIELSWTDSSSNETGFEIQRSADGSTGWTTIDTTAANVETYDDINLDVETTWYYRIRSVNDSGNSDWSSVVSATTFAPLDLGSELLLDLDPRDRESVITGGSRQFYAADKTSAQHADNAFLSTGDVDFLWAGSIRPDSVTGSQYIVIKTAFDSPTTLEYDLYLSGTSVVADLYHGDGSADTVTSSATVAIGKWYFVALWHDSTANTFHLRVNTTEDSVATTGAPVDAGGAYVFGKNEYADSNFFTGAIAQVLFAKGTAARTIIDSATEQTWLYNLGNGRLAGEVAARYPTWVAGTDFDFWNCNESLGTDSILSLSGSNDLTLTFGELLTDGGLENWASATDLTSWSESIGGTSTINQETVDVFSGSNAARFDIDGSNSLARISQGSVTVIGHTYLAAVRAKISTSGSAGFTTGGTNFGSAFSLATSYGLHSVTAVAQSTTFGIARDTATSNSIYIDALSLKATQIPAANGPSTDVVTDSSASLAHGTYNGAATSWKTDTADGTGNPTVYNRDSSGNALTTYPGKMVGFAAPESARSAHGLTGVPGQAVTFDGTDDKIVSLGAIAAIPTSGPMSMHIRFKHTGTSWRAIAVTSSNGFWTDGCGFAQVDTSKLRFFITNYSTVFAESDAAVNDGSWHSALGVWDGTNIKLYLDGVLQATADTYSGSLAHSKLTLGADPSSDYYAGDLADFRVWNADHSADAAAIAAGDSGATGSPVLRYDFNESSTRSLSSLGAGLSLEFDGVDDYVQTTYSTAIGTNDCSMSCWIKTSATQKAGIMSKRLSSGSFPGMAIWQCDDTSANMAGGKILITDGDTSTGFRLPLSDFTVNDGLWHHIVAVRNTPGAYLYIDGVLVKSATSTIVNLSRTDPVFMGCASNGSVPAASYYFNGKMDRAKFWASKALTQAEVLHLYTEGNIGTDPTSANLVGDWEMDDGPSGQPVDGDPVLELQSVEGNRLQFQQATASVRPIFAEAGINSLETLTFDGTKRLVCSSAIFSSVTAGTFFLIVKHSSVPNAYQVYVSTADTASATRRFYLARGNDANPHFNIAQRNNDTEDLLDGDTTLANATTYKLRAKSTGTATSVEVNDTAQTLNADTGANNGDFPGDVTEADNTVIGALVDSGGASLPFFGEFGRLIAVGSGVTADQLDMLDAYLDQLYGT